VPESASVASAVIDSGGLSHLIGPSDKLRATLFHSWLSQRSAILITTAYPLYENEMPYHTHGPSIPAFDHFGPYQYAWNFDHWGPLYARLRLLGPFLRLPSTAVVISMHTGFPYFSHLRLL